MLLLLFSLLISPRLYTSTNFYKRRDYDGTVDLLRDDMVIFKDEVLPLLSYHLQTFIFMSKVQGIIPL